jgi:cell division protein ZapA
VVAQNRDKLETAVKVVDEKMRSIRDAGKVAGLDRIAVMAALQLAHELLGARIAAANSPSETTEPSGAVSKTKSDAKSSESTSKASTIDSADLMRRIRKLSTDLDEEIRRQESLF